jgi:hypothetical protein
MYAFQGDEKEWSLWNWNAEVEADGQRKNPAKKKGSMEKAKRTEIKT